MPTWRIYYGDGSTRDDGCSDLPSVDVQCIVQRDCHGQRHVLDRFDYYWLEGQWYGGDLYGLFDYLARCKHACVIFGRSIPKHKHNEILQRAMEDPDFASQHSLVDHEMRRM